MAVVGLGAGGYLLADARAREQNEEAKAVAARDPGARDDVRTRAGVGSALLIGGGVLAVAATVLAMTTRWRNGNTTTALTLTPRAAGDRLLLGGAF